ncbi:metallophosphoesterase [Rubripirellula amarantea]|uniref:Putative metallophosphoesterase YhaO n=1 Tax=Rubripirellula amarantea TaxID=2527999 RepID=A0A5C5WUG7_9BACT|nr:metallophosphoesterase [Rubripirellula amarantea]MDA8743713.1 metallophosphoesterase [Rubripirellula amarantea]TWT54584.1 putative metallophosphoesterase YhaO [Rubripirellula amarantea]
MPGESFRFIHASDFHLENPLSDLDALPPHLRDAMADAPRRAASAVFEAALVDNIDFLVLSGDLLNPQTAGPHGMSLLLDYFDKLHAKKKPVFWTAGIVDDPARWPDAVPLPPNVTLFPKNRAIMVPVERAGRTIAMVVGRSSDGRNVLHVPSYRVDPTDHYTVAVGYGDAEAKALAEGRFDFWALGGQHNRTEIEGGADSGAVYCGTPQGRCLDEDGAHGYSTVDVDADGTTRVHAIECDTFRYVDIRITAEEIAAVGGIRNIIGEKIVRAQHEAGGRHLIVGFDVSIASGETIQSVGDVEELLTWVRREYGHGTPSAWTARINVRAPRQFPKQWTDEDTILGDFLRAAEKHRATEGRDMNLLPFTEEQPGLPSTTQSLLAEVASDQRTAVLGEATLLGVELLRGGKPNLVKSS